LGGWQVKIKEPADSVSGEDPLPGSWMAIFSQYMVERTRELSEVSFIRTLIPFVRVPP
jgi:hypothetical protein